MAGAIGMLLGWLTAQKGAPDFLMAVGGEEAQPLLAAADFK